LSRPYTFLPILVLAVLAAGVACSGTSTSRAPGPFSGINPSGVRAQNVMVGDLGAACAGTATTSEILNFNLGSYTLPSIPPSPTPSPLSGTNTKLDGPYNIFVDNNGDVWASNFNNATVTEYSSVTPHPTAAPARYLSGANTNLAGPTGIYVSESHGVNQYVYVADYTKDAIDIYTYSAISGSGAHNSYPSWILSGATTTLDNPESLVVDQSGNIWVANRGGADILEFSNPTGSTSGTYDPAPADTITSSALISPQGLYIDSHNNIWVGDGSKEAVLEFASGSGANATPIVDISGGATDISDPYGVAVDNGGNVYEVGLNYAQVNIWMASALTSSTVSSAPSYVISGGGTHLACPSGIQVYSNSGATDN
jgi:hypothetical protein